LDNFFNTIFKGYDTSSRPGDDHVNPRNDNQNYEE
jgi:hypothetical protein